MKVMQSSDTQIELMYQVQDRLNCLTIGPGWEVGNQDWKIALSAAVHEVLEHWGWAWDKVQSRNVQECKTNLIDCFSFLVSYAVTQNTQLSAKEFCLESRSLKYFYIKTMRDIWGTAQVEQLQEVLLGIASILGMSPTDIFYWFVGKQQLNILRQHKGYKQGTYSKLWFGEEDNVHLARILDEAKDTYSHIEPEVFESWIYRELEGLYNSWNFAPAETPFNQNPN
jgi:hypothetical protein